MRVARRAAEPKRLGCHAPPPSEEKAKEVATQSDLGIVGELLRRKG